MRLVAGAIEFSTEPPNAMNSTFSKPAGNRPIHGISILIGAAIVVAAAGCESWAPAPPLRAHSLTADISIMDQLKADEIPRLKARGFASVVDLRPDGEEVNQPSAAVIESAARANRLVFNYVPVARGDIPGDAVSALDKAIASSPKPILLYCGSGRRAARTWSLAEASRTGGLDADAILAAVKASGQSADDLSAAIRGRIANRTQEKRDAQ